MQNSDRPLRVGVVGCGAFARKAYAFNVVDSPDASLTALCDVDRSQAETLARELEGRTAPPAIYTDHRQMLDRESLDIVMVGTMTNVRPRIAIDALRAGPRVLAAKPMAPSLSEAEEMLQAAEQADRILMVGYNFRFREDARAIHRFIRDGGLGAPLFARAWSSESGIPLRGSHRTDSRSGGGSLARTAIHAMDLAVWFLGNPPLLSVEGQVNSRFADLPSLPSRLEPLRDNYGVPDLVSAYVRFANGVTMSVESAWMAPPQIQNNGVDIWGTHGYASLVPLRLFTWQDGDYVDRTEAVAPGLADAFRDDSLVRTRTEAFHFIDCALGRATPIVTPREMWTDQAIVDAVHAGHRDFTPGLT